MGSWSRKTLPESGCPGGLARDPHRHPSLVPPSHPRTPAVPSFLSISAWPSTQVLKQEISASSLTSAPPPAQPPQVSRSPRSYQLPLSPNDPCVSCLVAWAWLGLSVAPHPQPFPPRRLLCSHQHSVALTKTRLPARDWAIGSIRVIIQNRPGHGLFKNPSFPSPQD